MKNTAIISLVLFSSFIIMPTLAAIINNKCNTSLYYSAVEEEETNEIKLFEKDFVIKITELIYTLNEGSVYHEFLNKGHLLKIINCKEVIIPPPEFV